MLFEQTYKEIIIYFEKEIISVSKKVILFFYCVGTYAVIISKYFFISITFEKFNISNEIQFRYSCSFKIRVSSNFTNFEKNIVLYNVITDLFLNLFCSNNYLFISFFLICSWNSRILCYFWLFNEDRFTLFPISSNSFPNSMHTCLLLFQSRFFDQSLDRFMVAISFPDEIKLKYVS